MIHLPTCSQTRRLIVLCLLTLFLTLTQTPAIVAHGLFLHPIGPIAQLASPGTAPDDLSHLPPGVTRIGGIEITLVKCRGVALFKIASPTVFDRKNPGEQIPVEVRARRISEILDYIIGLNPSVTQTQRNSYLTTYDPATLEIKVGTLNKQTVLTATDAHRTEPQIIMTVTDQDAEYNGLSKDVLAEKWRQRLQTVLVEKLKARMPLELLRRTLVSLALIPLLVLVSAMLRLILRFLERRKQIYKARQNETSDASATALSVDGVELSAERRFEFILLLRRRYGIAQRLNLIDFCRWLLLWLIVLMWLFWIAFIIDQLPFIPLTMADILLPALQILFIWFLAGLVNRLGNVLISRSTAFWETQYSSSSATLRQRSLRTTTIANVFKGLKTFLIYLIAVVWILNTLNLSTSSILAFGAIVGFAISLASQNLVRDLVNGLLILLEDQFDIGDVIAVDGVAGFVENLNLRTTQLRNAEGRLIVLPNSTISRVENLTRTWSRVDHTIEVAASTNANQAIAVIQEVAQCLYDDPQFHPLIIEPPEVLGIDNVSHAGILIRTSIKTQPLQQWKVGREFRLRLKNALDEHNIPLGMPQQQTWHTYLTEEIQQNKNSHLPTDSLTQEQ